MDNYQLPDWEDVNSPQRDIFDIPEIEDIKSFRSTLGPEGVLQLGIQRSRIAKTERDNLNEVTAKILDGSLEREIKAQISEAEAQINKLIDSLGNSFKDPTARSMEDELDLDIRTMESMQPWTLAGLPAADLKALDPERLAMMKDPATGQFYTQEQWQAQISRAKREKNSTLIDQGAKIDPYEAAATMIFQLIDPKNADVMASVPEKLRQQKLEVYRNQKVRDFEATQKMKMAQLQFVSSKYSNLNDLYQRELKKQDDWALMIYNNEQKWSQFEEEINFKKWDNAINISNEILNNLQKLPPEQIKENLHRYNIMAGYVNTLEGKDVMKIYDDGDIQATYNEAKRRKTEETIKQVSNLIVPMRMKWELLNTTPGADEIKYINDTLAAFGPQFIANEGTDRVLTTKDLPFLIAFNRPSANTQTQREKTAAQERMNKDDNKTKKDIATQTNQTKKDIAATNNSSSSSKESKKWEDKLKQEEVRYNGLVAKYEDAIEKAKSILRVSTLPDKFSAGQIFRLKNAGVYTQLFDSKNGLAAQIKESEAKMKAYAKNMEDGVPVPQPSPKPAAPKAGKGTGDLRRSESGNPPTTLKSGSKVKF